MKEGSSPGEEKEKSHEARGQELSNGQTSRQELSGGGGSLISSPALVTNADVTYTKPNEERPSNVPTPSDNEGGLVFNGEGQPTTSSTTEPMTQGTEAVVTKEYAREHEKQKGCKENEDVVAKKFASESSSVEDDLSQESERKEADQTLQKGSLRLNEEQETPNQLKTFIKDKAEQQQDSSPQTTKESVTDKQDQQVLVEEKDGSEHIGAVSPQAKPNRAQPTGSTVQEAEESSPAKRGFQQQQTIIDGQGIDTSNQEVATAATQSHQAQVGVENAIVRTSCEALNQ